MIMRVLVFSVVGLFALCDFALAELHQYTDENGILHITDDRGSVQERERKRVKIVDDDRGPSSRSRASNKTPEAGRSSGPAAAHTPEPAQPPPPASQPAQPDPPNQQLVTINTDTQTQARQWMTAWRSLTKRSQGRKNDGSKN